MKEAKPDDKVHPEELLHLWMAEKGQGAAPRHRRGPSGLKVAAVIVACIVALVMAKYAIDVLGILLALVAIGLVLHTLEVQLAESNILSPGWLIIIVLAIAFFAYAFFVPAQSVAGLSRYTPRWMRTALEWSEQRGWAGRALGGPGGGPTEPAPAPEPAPPATASYDVPSPSSTAEITLSASSSTSTYGQPVTFMARLPASDSREPTILFYDGSTLLGTAKVVRDRQAKIAYLQISSLATGIHDIRAELPPGFGSTLLLSKPLQHVVRAR